MRSRVILFAAVSLLVLACEPEVAQAPRVGAASQAILGGKKDATHKAVLGVVYDNGPASEFCTGYLITPDLLLTARHCVLVLEAPNGGCVGEGRTTAGELFDVEKMLVFTETSPSGPEAGLPVAEILTPEDPTLCGNDLALLRLASPLTDLAPIALRVDAPPVIGEALTVVGYGATKGGPDTSSGTRRSRSGVRVASVGESARAVEGEWTITEGPCAGDSGGPALDLSGASLGVMSRGDQETCEGMVYERLDPHADWLRAAARDSAKRLGGKEPAWAAGPDQGVSGGSGGAGVGGTNADGEGGAGDLEGGGAGGSGDATTASAGDDGGCTLTALPAASPRSSPGAWVALLAALASGRMYRRRAVDGA